METTRDAWLKGVPRLTWSACWDGSRPGASSAIC